MTYYTKRKKHVLLVVLVAQWLTCVWLFETLELQHDKLLCPPLSLRVCSNSCPFWEWLCLTISSSVSPSPPAYFPSTGVFSNDSVLCIKWAKFWSLSFSISPSNEYSELISFSIDWFDLLAVQGSHKTLLQHDSSKASILHHSAFFMVQLSHPYMMTEKTIALTTQVFVSKVMFLLFNNLPRFFITFLPKNKHLLILW